MYSYLTSKIAERTQRVLELERDLLTARAELRTLQDVLKHLDRDPVLQKEDNGVRAELLAEPPKNKRPSTHFQRSEHWKKVFTLLAESGEAFRASDVIAAAELVNVPMKVPNVRSQIAYYFKKNILQRSETGKYTLTEAGLNMLREAEGAGEVHLTGNEVIADST